MLRVEMENEQGGVREWGMLRASCIMFGTATRPNQPSTTHMSTPFTQNLGMHGRQPCEDTHQFPESYDSDTDDEELFQDTRRFTRPVVGEAYYQIEEQIRTHNLTLGTTQNGASSQLKFKLSGCENKKHGMRTVSKLLGVQQDTIEVNQIRLRVSIPLQVHPQDVRKIISSNDELFGRLEVYNPTGTFRCVNRCLCYEENMESETELLSKTKRLSRILMAAEKFITSKRLCYNKEVVPLEVTCRVASAEESSGMRLTYGYEEPNKQQSVFVRYAEEFPTIRHMLQWLRRENGELEFLSGNPRCSTCKSKRIEKNDISLDQHVLEVFPEAPTPHMYVWDEERNQVWKIAMECARTRLVRSPGDVCEEYIVCDVERRFGNKLTLAALRSHLAPRHGEYFLTASIEYNNGMRVDEADDVRGTTLYIRWVAANRHPSEGNLLNQLYSRKFNELSSQLVWYDQQMEQLNKENKNLCVMKERHPSKDMSNEFLLFEQRIDQLFMEGKRVQQATKQLYTNGCMIRIIVSNSTCVRFSCELDYLDDNQTSTLFLISTLDSMGIEATNQRLGLSNDMPADVPADVPFQIWTDRRRAVSEVGYDFYNDTEFSKAVFDHAKKQVMPNSPHKLQELQLLEYTMGKNDNARLDCLLQAWRIAYSVCGTTDALPDNMDLFNTFYRAFRKAEGLGHVRTSPRLGFCLLCLLDSQPTFEVSDTDIIFALQQMQQGSDLIQINVVLSDAMTTLKRVVHYGELALQICASDEFQNHLDTWCRQQECPDALMGFKHRVCEMLIERLPLRPTNKLVALDFHKHGCQITKDDVLIKLGTRDRRRIVPRSICSPKLLIAAEAKQVIGSGPKPITAALLYGKQEDVCAMLHMMKHLSGVSPEPQQMLPLELTHTRLLRQGVCVALQLWYMYSAKLGDLVGDIVSACVQLFPLELKFAENQIRALLMFAENEMSKSTKTEHIFITAPFVMCMDTIKKFVDMLTEEYSRGNDSVTHLHHKLVEHQEDVDNLNALTTLLRSCYRFTRTPKGCLAIRVPTPHALGYVNWAQYEVCMIANDTQHELHRRLHTIEHNIALCCAEKQQFDSQTQLFMEDMQQQRIGQLEQQQREEELTENKNQLARRVCELYTEKQDITTELQRNIDTSMRCVKVEEPTAPTAGNIMGGVLLVNNKLFTPARALSSYEIRQSRISIGSIEGAYIENGELMILSPEQGCCSYTELRHTKRTISCNGVPIQRTVKSGQATYKFMNAMFGEPKKTQDGRLYWNTDQQEVYLLNLTNLQLEGCVPGALLYAPLYGYNPDVVQKKNCKRPKRDPNEGEHDQKSQFVLSKSTEGLDWQLGPEHRRRIQAKGDEDQRLHCMSVETLVNTHGGCAPSIQMREVIRPLNGDSISKLAQSVQKILRLEHGAQGEASSSTTPTLETTLAAPCTEWQAAAEDVRKMQLSSVTSIFETLSSRLSTPDEEKQQQQQHRMIASPLLDVPTVRAIASAMLQIATMVEERPYLRPNGVCSEDRSHMEISEDMLNLEHMERELRNMEAFGCEWEESTTKRKRCDEQPFDPEIGGPMGRDAPGDASGLENWRDDSTNW